VLVRMALLILAMLSTIPRAVFAQSIQPAPPGATTGTAITGLLLDQQGVGIPGARVTLFRAATAVAETRTRSTGDFSFKDVAPGTYSIAVSAPGYGTTRSDNIALRPGDSNARVSLVVERSTTADTHLREIGRVSTTQNSSTALQTTATITRRLDPQVAQSENFTRVGNALEQLPGVNLYNKNVSVGDDLYADIRGLKPSETQTLLDGHPIGPIGVAPGTSGTFNMQDSPTFALRSVQTTYGAGALGLYGTNTTGGSIDFQTFDPIPGHHAYFEQGIGNQGKTSTNLRVQGEEGKVGFAGVYAVQGLYGPFAPQTIFQNGNLSQDFTVANAKLNTYTVSAVYTLRNALLKARYDFSSATHLTLTGYSATSYDDKTGNGDNDASTYQGQYYIAPTNAASAAFCPGGVTVKTDHGQSCLSRSQWATATAGPQGAYPAFQNIGNQDYHARLTTTLGKNNFTLDGFLDAYNLIYNRNAASYDATAGIFNGGFNQDIFHTSGVLASDDIISAKNQFGFGYYVQHQLVTGTVYQQPVLVARQPAALGNGSVFIRDGFTPADRLSFYTNVWVKTSTSTHGSTIDPRFSVVFRPTPADVVRFGVAKSEGDPDPSLAGGNLNTTPTNLNPPCGAFKDKTGMRLNVGQIGNANIGPETATDLEVAYAHRFKGDTILNVDLYDTNEANEIFNAEFSATQFPGEIPPFLLREYFAQIQNVCSITPTLDNLSLSQASNYSSGRFQGIEISGRIRITPHVFADYSYDLQSARQLGVPVAILQSNPTIINGAQLLGIPLHKQFFGVDYSTPGGIETRVDAFHLDDNNGLNRPGYTFANGFLSYSAPTRTTFTFGMYNMFNSAAAIYGQIGLGIFRAENQYGTDRNSFDQGVKYRGQTPRSFSFSIGEAI